VALVYFDASALMKLVVDEQGTDLAVTLWDGCDAPLSSRLAYPEVCTALAAASRNHDLRDDEVALARESWEEFWAAVRPVELTSAVTRLAGQLTRRHALRGADAVHLASALAVADPDLVVAAWDRRLHAGAAAERLAVTPAALPPSG
jgi:predicted nucleic acid-binding protein